VVGCTGVGSFTGWNVLVFVVLHCGGIYWSWYFYSLLGYTGVCSFTVWCDILDLVALQCWDILELVVLQCSWIYWSW
jgi:hypothetical protein